MDLSTAISIVAAIFGVAGLSVSGMAAFYIKAIAKEEALKAVEKQEKALNEYKDKQEERCNRHKDESLAILKQIWEAIDGLRGDVKELWKK